MPVSDVASLVSPVTARLVVVALVDVVFWVMRFEIVEDAAMLIPIEVVGERAPRVISKVLPNALYPAGA